MAALAGFGTMSVELAAVRLLAPWFGTSLAVWTNVIGVVLLALSLGYAWGARMAEREEPFRRLGLHLLLGGALCAFLPALAAPVCGWLLPEQLALGEAAEVFRWGSLAASCALFLPPALVLGAVPPLAVESLQRSRGGSAGASGGRVLFVSTLGSLAGTFATTYVLVPELGLRASFLGLGLLLGGMGALVVVRRGAPSQAALLLLPALAGLSAFGYSRPTPPDKRVLAERESAYQFLRVVESGSLADGTLERQLLVNEGLDSYQSLWRPEPGLLGAGEYYYYDPFALPAHWSRARGPWRVLVLGLGAGTAVRVLSGTVPEGVDLQVTGVELDPGVVELGHAHMELALGAQDLVVASGLDARAALRALPGPFDQIILDAYANQTEIPSHLATREFFDELKTRLAPTGWLCVNVGAFDLEDPVLLSVGATAASAFERDVQALRVPASRNAVLFVRREGAVPQPGSADWAVGEPVAALLPRLELDAHRRSIGPLDGRALSDDRGGLEHLQLESLRRARAWVAQEVAR